MYAIHPNSDTIVLLQSGQRVSKLRSKHFVMLILSRPSHAGHLRPIPCLDIIGLSPSHRAILPSQLDSGKWAIADGAVAEHGTA
jgi:hypothetical protein